MKTNQKSSKFLKNFEIGKGKQSNVLGGNPWITKYTIPGSDASNEACPDSKQDLYPDYN